jgi:alkanesulfonate monooxygenase SsuD/methylene tetrahydromethanopterin reductase-like flavin-dependent oxidoreductase (luciferase family)
VKIGALAISHCPATGDSAAAYDTWLQIGLEAERLGLWSYWTTQHHFGSERDYRPYGVSEDIWETTDYDMAADPLTLLTYLAAKTTNLRLGTAVSVLNWDDPLRIAERAAMLDVLSGGRLELGVGRGNGFREQVAFDVPVELEAATRRFREGVEVIRRAWTGEPFSYEGEFFNYSNLIMVPRPTRQPAPIWVGVASDRTAAWAAEQRLPYATVTWPLIDLAAHASKRAAFERAAREHDVDTTGWECPHFLYMHCCETDEEAREIAEHCIEQFQYILDAHYQHSEGRHRIFLGADTQELTVDKVTRQTLETQPIGSPRTILERIRTYDEAVGLNYLIVNIGFGDMPRETTLASLRLFMEQVAPHVQ